MARITFDLGRCGTYGNRDGPAGSTPAAAAEAFRSASAAVASGWCWIRLRLRGYRYGAILPWGYPYHGYHGYPGGVSVGVGRSASCRVSAGLCRATYVRGAGLRIAQL